MSSLRTMLPRQLRNGLIRWWRSSSGGKRNNAVNDPLADPTCFARAQRLADITQCVGFALWQVQELEGVAAQYLVLRTKALLGMGSAAGNELVAKAQSRTFGFTLREIAGAGLFESELQARFDALLSERTGLCIGRAQPAVRPFTAMMQHKFSSPGLTPWRNYPGLCSTRSRLCSMPSPGCMVSTKRWQQYFAGGTIAPSKVRG